MPSPVRLTEAMRTDSSSVRTSASERSRTADSIMGATSGKRGLQLLEALHHLLRRALGELAFDHLAVERHLLLPLRLRYRVRRGDAIGADGIEARHVERLRHVAERRFDGLGIALDPPHDPLEHAHVLAVAG